MVEVIIREGGLVGRGLDRGRAGEELTTFRKTEAQGLHSSDTHMVKVTGESFLFQL